MVFSVNLLINPIFKALTSKSCSTSSSSSNLRPFPMPPSSSNIVAEYAKSNRTTCRGCNKSIRAKTLRLGLTTQDPRGFVATKWHHLECFSSDFDHVDSIKGFDSLETVDQEALKKLAEDDDRKAKGKTEERSVDGALEAEEGETKKQKTVDKEALNKLAEDDDRKAKGKTKKRSVDEALEADEGETKKQKTFDKEALNKLAEADERKAKGKTEERSVDGALEAEEGETKKQKTVEKEALNKLAEDDERKAKGKTEERSVDGALEAEEGETKKQKLSVTSEVIEVEIPLSIVDIKNKYKDAKLKPKWKAFRTIIFLERDDGLQDSSKIAAFDFDGCLVNTAVNRIGADAWSLMYPCIPDKLQKLHTDGYKLVIFTNESNIERWKNKRQKAVDSKIGRLNNFIKCVNVPIQVFIACGFDKKGAAADPFRKPKPGMWHIMEKHFNSGIEIDMDQSFYVGDAAGRTVDHSDADIKFAEAVGLKFYVPEEYFDA